MNSTERDDYGAELTEELQLRDVPHEAIERIVREVRSHLAESGEDPRDSFGSPQHYADQFVPRSWTRRMLWPIVALAGLLGAGAGFMLLSGAFGLIDPSAQLCGLAPGVRLAIGGVCLAGFIGLVAWMAVGSCRRSASWALPE
ncbi:MAG: HAAS signaling domain-containing protein [Pseudoclavibacter sp.]